MAKLLKLVPKDNLSDEERKRRAFELLKNVFEAVGSGEMNELIVIGFGPDGSSRLFHTGTPNRLELLGALEALKMRMFGD